MIEFLRQLITGVTEAWKRLSTSARVQIGLAAILTVAILVSVIVFGGQPQYIELYSRLEPAESDAVIEYLTETGIDYQLREGGRTIRVPAQRAGSARVALASQGIPRSQGAIPGFEVFDTQTLMTNRWLQDVNFMRAVQGAAIRDINQFDFVRSSSVFIREAKDALFRNDQKPSEASVILNLTRPITDEEIAAVLHTVSAYGGHNLNAKNITIADTTGRILKRPDADDSISIASHRRDIEAGYRMDIERRVQAALKGMGYNAIVTASVQVDWDTVEMQQRQVAPGEVISSLNSETTTSTSELPPEGAPGAFSNIPEGQVLPGGTETTSETSELTENFDPSETVTKTMTPPGTLEKISVAVVVDDKRVDSTDEAGGVTFAREAPTAQELTAIETLVTNAVASASTLPPEVSVTYSAFPTDTVTLAGLAPTTPEAPWFQNRILITVLQGFLILAAFFAIRYFMRRALTVPAAEEDEAVEIPEASKEDVRRMEVAAEVERLSREDPEAVAALLRSWMAEED